MDNHIDALNILLHVEGHNSSSTLIHTVPIVAQRDLLEAIDKSCIKNWCLTVLQAAVEIGNLELVERLLAAGADINALASPGYNGQTALQAAAKGGHIQVKLRLEQARACR